MRRSTVLYNRGEVASVNKESINTLSSRDIMRICNSNSVNKYSVNNVQKYKCDKIQNVIQNVNNVTLENTSPNIEVNICNFNKNSKQFCNNMTKFVSDKIWCKNSKKEFLRKSDYNEKYGIIEFRSVMFEYNQDNGMINKFIAYKNEELQGKEIDGHLNYTMCQQLLINYHDPEIFYVMKYGIKVPKLVPKINVKFCNSPMTYTHCDAVKVRSEYFEKSKMSGPYSKRQIIKYFDPEPVIVGTIMSISKKESSSVRYVVDKKIWKYNSENLTSYNVKLRLPSLRELGLFLELDNIVSASVVDYCNYYRQVRMHKNDANSCVLKYTEEGCEDKFYIDLYAQMGSQWVPLNCQRLSSAICFLFNLYNKEHSTALSYQDDTFIANYDEESQYQNYRNFCELAEKIGLKLKREKSQVCKKCISWLGVDLNFLEKSISPSSKRIMSIRKSLNEILKNKYTTLHQVQSVMGKISSLDIMNNMKGVLYNFRELDKEILFKEKPIIEIESCHQNELKLALKCLEKLEKNTVITFSLLKFLVAKNYILEKTVNLETSKYVYISEIKNALDKLRLSNYNYIITDACLESSAGIIITPFKCFSFEFMNYFDYSMSIDKYECLCIIVGAMLCPSDKAKGFIYCTDSEISRYVLHKSNAKTKCLRRLSTLLTHKMSCHAKWYCVLRISSESNYIVDRLSRKLNVQQCCDIKCEKIDQALINKVVDYVFKKTIIIKDEEFLATLLDDTDLKRFEVRL